MKAENIIGTKIAIDGITGEIVSCKKCKSGSFEIAVEMPIYGGGQVVSKLRYHFHDCKIEDNGKLHIPFLSLT